MKRKPSSMSQASAVAMLSAGVVMASGPQVLKGLPAAQKAPATPQALPAIQQPGGGLQATAHTIKFAGTFLKWRGGLSVAGMMNGRPVFRTPQGEFFQVEPNTGDLQFHSAESLGFLKLGGARTSMAAPAAMNFIKWGGIKGEQRVSVLGVDAQGHVIQENSRGERFYLGPFGDMVFVR